MSPPNPALIEIYEDRIARLEEGVTDCKVDLGIVKTQIADGVKMLSEKLDAVAVLSERVAVLETKEKVYVSVKASEEIAHSKRRERRVFLLKVAAGAVSAVVAVVGLILKVAFGG